MRFQISYYFKRLPVRTQELRLHYIRCDENKYFLLQLLDGYTLFVSKVRKLHNNSNSSADGSLLRTLQHTGKIYRQPRSFFFLRNGRKNDRLSYAKYSTKFVSYISQRKVLCLCGNNSGLPKIGIHVNFKLIPTRIYDHSKEIKI